LSHYLGLIYLHSQYVLDFRYVAHFESDCGQKSQPIFTLFPSIKLANMAITNAFQLEAVRATPSHANYEVSESIHWRICFCCWYITLRCDLDLKHLQSIACVV